MGSALCHDLEYSILVRSKRIQIVGSSNVFHCFNMTGCEVVKVDFGAP